MNSHDNERLTGFGQFPSIVETALYRILTLVRIHYMDLGLSLARSEGNLFRQDQSILPNPVLDTPHVSSDGIWDLREFLPGPVLSKRVSLP